MEYIRFTVFTIYLVFFIWMIHAPVDLGIQSLHLHKEGKTARALIAISAGWLISTVMFFLGYSAGIERIFG